MSFERAIRLRELSAFAQRLPAEGRILEVGAGAGWQSEAVSERGASVFSVDLPTSSYRTQQSTPIIQYDGRCLPFRDGVFQAVYSSNVLEHVVDQEALQAEIHRVLAPGGLAVHLMPSASWRFWTILTHYPFLVKHVFLKLIRWPREGGEGTRLDRAIDRRGWRSLAGRYVFPERHGETGRVLTETYYFSRLHWRRKLTGLGWRVSEVYPTRLFYTGYNILDRLIPLGLRSALSYFLGSSCLVYVLRDVQPEDRPCAG